VIGFIFSAVAGMIVARALPYVWVYLDPVLTPLLGRGGSASDPRDIANKLFMTAITAFTSFYLAYRTFRKP
jgi:hypothetical protein